MKKTVKEILRKEFFGKTDMVDWEFYRYNSRDKRLYTDDIDWVYPEEVNDDTLVNDYFVLDEEEYNHTVNANTDDEDFSLYTEDSDIKNPKILVMMVD